MWSFTKGAKGKVESHRVTMIAGILRLTAMVARARLSGDYKRTPLFLKDTGAPISAPKILSRNEREAVRNAV
jgi:hypothetical protein